MKLYLTDKQVPELSDLEDYRRSTVRDGAFKLFCKERCLSQWWFRLPNVLLALLGISAYDVSDAVGNQFWTSVMVAFFTVSIIGIVYQSFLTEHLRPYFQRYIEEHRDEIGRAG